MADSGLLPLPHVAVLDGLNLRPLEHFTGTGWPAQLRIVTEAAVKAEAERINSVVAFVDFHAIDTTGDCAVVFVGAQRWLPSYGMGGNCCCSTKDVYVKRDGRWIYGARVASYCDCEACFASPSRSRASSCARRDSAGTSDDCRDRARDSERCLASSRGAATPAARPTARCDRSGSPLRDDTTCTP